MVERMWEKIINDKTEIAYGEPNTNRIIRAEKVRRGWWAVQTGIEKIGKPNERVYAQLELHTNAISKKHALEIIKDYIEEQEAN